MSILVSVAHSSKSQGACDANGVLTEYHVSLRASTACWRALSGEFQCELYDCGPLSASEYDEAKVAKVNLCLPELAVEIHCNAGPPGAKYHETIYASEHSKGKEPAITICDALSSGFSSGHHRMWPRRGARVDDRGLFFLQRTKVPCVIVEGLFISNEEQAQWLGNGGAEAYGILVASGIKHWLKGHKS